MWCPTGASDDSFDVPVGLVDDICGAPVGLVNCICGARLGLSTYNPPPPPGHTPVVCVVRIVHA